METSTFVSMKGRGYYSKSTLGAQKVIEAAVPFVLSAIQTPLEGILSSTSQASASSSSRASSSVFRVADMGCADGGTSISLWSEIFRFVRSKSSQLPIEIFYTDLPSNDFSQLFRTIHGQTEAKTYFGEIEEVYPFASGTSFHQAIFPRETLHFGFSATASHYISKVPCNLSNHIHMIGALEGEERKLYEEVGALEWDRMLGLRAKELVIGGTLCLLNFGIDSKGRYLGNTPEEEEEEEEEETKVEGKERKVKMKHHNMFDTFNKLWLQLVKEGVITLQEYQNTNFPQVYRTREQFVAPFSDPNSQTFKAGLRLVTITETHLPCPYAKKFQEEAEQEDNEMKRNDENSSEKDKERKERFAKEYIPTLRSWSETTFLHGLSGRSLEQKNGIMDEFYSRYERLVAESPEGHGMDYIHLNLICVKVPP